MLDEESKISKLEEVTSDFDQSLTGIEEAGFMAARSLCSLSMTTHLERRKGDVIWDSIFEIYQEPERYSTNQKRLVTTINAILTHNRIVFTLSRGGVQRLLEEDKNWSCMDKPKLGHGNSYRKYIAFLTLQHCKLIEEGAGRRPAIYEVVYPPLRARLEDNGANAEAQERELTKFVGKKSGQKGGVE